MDNNITILISKLSRYQKKYLSNHLKNTDLEDSQAIVLIKIKEHEKLSPKEIYEKIASSEFFNDLTKILDEVYDEYI